MFLFNNLTDFEKLLFTRSQVNELKKEIIRINLEKGVLQSEIIELNYHFKLEKPENDKLRKYKIQIKNTRLKTKEWKRKYEQCNNELIKLKNGKNSES